MRSNYHPHLPLHKAAVKGDMKTLDEILKKDPNAVRALVTGASETALMVASPIEGNKEFVKKLISLMSPKDLAMQDSFGQTALIGAILAGDLEVVKLMVEKNPDLPNIRDMYDQIPLFDAPYYCHNDAVVRYLLDVTNENYLLRPQAALLVAGLIYGGFFDMCFDLLDKNTLLAVTPLEILTLMHSAFLSGTKLNSWQSFIYSYLPDEELNKYGGIGSGDVENPKEETVKGVNARTSMSMLFWELTAKLGLPFIGQSLGLLNALKADTVEEWFQKRITKHGPIWKTGLFGYPTVVLHGTAANKFVYTCDGSVLSNTQPPSISRIVGSKNIIELVNDDHKRVRAALVSFLRLEVLKQYVAKVDEEIQYHLQTHWTGKHEVQVQTLIKTLTFNVICSLLFGIERGPKREKLLPLFQDMIEGVLAIPINLPFTQFNRGIIARKKLVPMLVDLIQEKREALTEQKRVDPHKDLITSLLSIRDDNNLPMMSDEEIVDNIIVVMIAGYDTTSVLLTFLVRLLATNESIYFAIAREQEEIAKNKALGEALTWEDLTKMKYTWRVASEMLRINPPVILSFRRTVQDIEYGGYIIPKGWQVLLSASMTHMDSNIFQNPNMFDPTRFEKNAPSLPPFSFVAFGGGPRMCPGIELAKMETLAMMHRLVTQFTWVLINKDGPFKRIPMPEFDKGLLVRIKPIKATSMPSEERSTQDLVQ